MCSLVVSVPHLMYNTVNSKDLFHVAIEVKVMKEKMWLSKVNGGFSKVNGGPEWGANPKTPKLVGVWNGGRTLEK